MNKNPIGQKALSLLLSLTLILSVFGMDTTGAFAAQDSRLKHSAFSAMRSGAPVTLYLDSGDIVIDDANVTQGGQPVARDAQDNSLLITQKDSGVAIAHTIIVKSGIQNITLQNVNVKPGNGCAFEVQYEAEADITLIGNNTLDARNNSIQSAGLTANQGSTVHISGTGSLTAYGWGASAGIGGSTGVACGTIEISGGSIKAIGGITNNSSGPGIGSGGVGGYGGSGGDGGSITISGGKVMATGGTINGASYGSAGIGGGYCGSVTSIQISGSSIVTATGGDGGAGIGGGGGNYGGSITISGGNVTATGAGGGAGIGGGSAGNGGNVVISGLTNVTAKGQSGGHDIGSGNGNPSGGSLTVSGGATVVMLNSDSSLNTNAANPNTNTAPPKYINCQVITGNTEKTYDSNGNVTAIKQVLYLDDGSITVNSHGYSVGGGSVTPYNGNYFIIQRNSGTAIYNTITVQSGTHDITIDNISINVSTFNVVCAFSIAEGAAVNLTLEGTNTLRSGSCSSGITTSGDSDHPNDPSQNASLTIMKESTGSLTAVGGYGAAGIGGSIDQPGGIIKIQGGTIKATGGIGGAGIGGAFAGNGGTIQISGGSITATGGWGGAGIGGGAGGSIVNPYGGSSEAQFNGAGGTIQISGGNITAIGNNGGAGIGGGTGGTADFVDLGQIVVPGGAGGAVTITGTDTKVSAQGSDGSWDFGCGKGGNGGTLRVSGVGLDKGPEITLFSTGIHDTNPSGTNPQFMFCTIDGVGAKDASGTDIHGCYDSNGKIRLSVILSTPAAAKIGVPVLLTATVLRYYFYDTIPFSPSYIHFTDNGTTKLGDSVFIAPNGTAQTMWTPTRTTGYQLMASYIPDALSPYASTDSSIIDYVPGKFTPVVSVLPTASTVAAGSLLSASTLSGGIMLDASGNAVSGTFAWASPNDKAATTSNYYSVVFIPSDTDNYNAVAGITIPVTVTPTPTPTPTPAPTPSPAPQSTSGSSSHGTSKPSLPISLTDTPTNTTADLSGAAFPVGVTGVSLSVTPEATVGAPSTPGNAGIPSDPQSAEVYRLIISQTNLNLIGSPFVYNIKLLDQNGNPITSFTGTVTVKVAIPTGIHGTPHLFRYEDSTGTFTDLNATVENGFLEFKTTHFSYYVIAGTGDSVTLDTKSYQLPVGASYQIGLKLTGGKAASVKLYSTNDKIASAARLKNGNALVTGKGPGTAYIMFDVFDSKNKLLTHASVRVDVKTGIRPRGDSTRQIGLF